MNKYTYLSTKGSVVGRIALLALLIVGLAACVDPNGGNNPNGGDNTGGGGNTDDGFDANGIHRDKPVITAGNTLAGVYNSQFGNAAAFSGDGNTVLVGAYLIYAGANLSGEAYVFTRQGDGWIQQAQHRPTASDFTGDIIASDGFGYAVAISDDGNTALIGAWEDDLFYTGDNTGAAYVFIRQSDGTWTDQPKLTGASQGDKFGSSVALSGDGSTALIGAPNRLSNQGAAYVFTWDGTTWTQQQLPDISNRATVGSARFGASVALSDDGNTALVGASSATAGAGAAYVYTWDGTTWTERRILNGEGGNFGVSVALSGNTALVGASSANAGAGAAYVFTGSGSTWEQQARLTADDTVGGDQFGFSVALSGNIALVGAYEGDATTSNTDTGTAYVFTRSGDSWSGGIKLIAGDTAADNNAFGSSVALSGSVTSSVFAVIGSPRGDSAGNDHGSAYIFRIKE